ncbi:type IV toxin-antitoxin system AbiEi family antitoxin domain-containing protein [Terrimonas alba]|uniref:type IV toxin-antitoxin system AbiEi family antitoxin domain-containing protein n=1 Tax=Terrimonas alba TaxID=3349636 RepID=UPI0035F277FC
MELLEAIRNYAEQPITRQLLLDLLKNYKRPFDKIDELVKQGILIQLKRGIYIPGPELKIAGPEPFLLANYLAGPSYVSLDSALSHWGLIPERVYEISSVTIGPSKIYKTSVGRFSYTHLRLPYYAFGIKQVELTKKQAALIATPEKALCDKIITTAGLLLRSSKQVIELLIEDLRIEKQALQHLNTGQISKWVEEAPKKDSLNMLVKTLKNL